MYCFRCKQHGHIPKLCPDILKTKTCFKCGKTGHVSMNCTEAPLESGNSHHYDVSRYESNQGKTIPFG